jgi:hypothetical protein
LILAKRVDGKYAATIGGTGLSIPRQVGKTFLVGAIVFALCLLFPNLTVIWTAHRLKTAEETFGKMLVFAKRRKIKPHILKTPLGSGDEAIIFRNGSRILFGARERGFGRGFDEVDVLIFDEAQILTDNALDDMIPATNQSRQEAGALLLFLGTPPKPTDRGEVFTRMRADALSGDDDTGWVEFSADPDFRPTPLPAPLTETDWRQVGKANPSFPQDTPRESILRMRKKLGDDSFLREGLGIWDEDTDFEAAWLRCADPESAIVGPVFLAAAMTPDRSTVSLAAAGRRSDGLLHVEIVLHGRAGGKFGDQGWNFVPEAAATAGRQGAAVALVPSHPVGSLQADLEKAGARITPLTTGDYTRGCGAFFDDVLGHRLRYISPQPELDAAISRATRKSAGESWRWAGDDISALVAATQATQAARMAPVGGKGRAIALN